MQVALQEQTDSASELAQLAKSAEALAAESEELMVATGQIVALSQQLAKSHASFDNSAIDPNHNDPTVEQPAAVMVAQSEMMLEQQHPDSASAQVESTVEQPRPPIIAAG